MYKLIAISGIMFFVMFAVLISEKRKAIDWRIVLWGFALQFLAAFLVLKTALGNLVFSTSRNIVNGLLGFSEQGAVLLFGELAKNPSYGCLFAFRVLPVVIFISSLMAVLWYFRIIQFFVKGLAWLMYRTMKISGVEAFISALFVFMGIEATTAVKGYIQKMTRSELFTMMAGFMATIAGSVMVLYTTFGVEAGHLLAASVMSAPAAVLIAKIMIPETEEAQTDGTHRIDVLIEYDNPIDAASSGAAQGLQLALNIGAMVLAFVSIVALIDYPLSLFDLSLAKLLGYAMVPFAFFMGVPWENLVDVGQLIGTKTVLNEFLAYLSMGQMIEAKALLPRSITIATYALCGFANFGSLGILIGALNTLVPERKKEVVSLGVKAIVAGTIAAFLTATIAGLLV